MSSPLASPNERLFPLELRLGKRQHWWIYHCRDASLHAIQFVPTCHGKPPEVLRSLVKRGLMWATKKQSLKWMPRKQCWSAPQPGPEHWCGLTDKGIELVVKRTEILHDKHLEEHGKRAEAGDPDYDQG